jgi:RNA polymerase-binding transcription factor DksA
MPGSCEVCGQPIESRRLEIMPETPLRRNCMSLQEKLARVTAR